MAFTVFLWFKCIIKANTDQLASQSSDITGTKVALDKRSLYILRKCAYQLTLNYKFIQK